VNVSYLNYQQQKGFTIRSFTPSGTIDLEEEKYNHLLQFFANKFYTQKKHNQKLFQK
jgi:hypothetical protein